MTASSASPRRVIRNVNGNSPPGDISTARHVPSIAAGFGSE
jgi:hypothetical protein